MSEEVNLKKIEKKRDKFIDSALLVKEIFLKENIPLRFNNYKNTINEFAQIDDLSLDLMYNLNIDLNLWYQFFSDLESLSEMVYLKKQNIKLYIEGFPFTPKNEERLKEVTLDIVKIKNFMKQLKVQRKLFSNMSFILLEKYNSTVENYLYRY